jgi:hypothetical protein
MHSCKNTPLRAGSKIWTSHQHHPQAKVQACHWKRNVDPHHTCQTMRVLHGNAHSWTATLQEQYVAEHKILMQSYNDYLGIEETGKELILYPACDDALALVENSTLILGTQRCS